MDSDLPTPVVRASEPRVVAQRPGEAVPQAPQRDVSLSGIDKPIRFIDQYGSSAVILAVMIVLTFSMLGAVYHLQDRAMTMMQYQFDQRREDERDRDKRHETHQDKMWRRMGELVESQRNSADEMRKATSALEDTVISIRALTKKCAEK